MANKKRGGLSKREYAQQQGGSTASMGDNFADTSRNIKNELLRQYSAVTGDANLQAMADQEYLKRGGAQLDRDIKKVSGQFYKEGINAVEKYAEMGISNPNSQMALAQESQRGVGIGVTGLTDERTRRQAAIQDYIDMWDKTYGAQAKKAQSGSGTFKSITDSETTAMIAEMKKQGGTWEEIAQYMQEQYGTDITTGSHFDVQANQIFGTGKIPKKPTAASQKEVAPKKQAENKYYEAYNLAMQNPDQYEYDEETGDIYEVTKSPGWFGDKKTKKLIARKVK